MPYNYQHKKRTSSDDSDHSDSSSEVEKCGRGNCCDQSRAYIVCPPCDYKEKYDSSGSENSCPDFTDLCEDKPRICCEKKSCKEESSDSSSESSDDDCEKCKGCNRGCGSCNNCKSCGCKQCSDYSRSSVLNSLGASESASDCPNFDRLACDEKRKCIPLFDSHQHDNSTKDASKKDNGERKGKNKQVKSFSSSASASSRGKKFIVSFGPKEGHQWAKYNRGDESIHINGKNGPVLHLYRGSTYFFCVEQCNVSDLSDSSSDDKHFFFLTDSPCGGVGSQAIQSGFAPVSKGCVCFKVDKCTPRYFFYQSSCQAFQGGLVIVHDK